MPADSAITIVLVYPELLGTYGDRGNALALAHRAAARGMPCTVLPVAHTEALPAQGDVYLLGGGEDTSMALAWSHLRGDTGMATALAGGAACLGVCAGFQLLGRRFAGPDGSAHEGMGLLDVECGRLPGARAVGEVVAETVGLPGVPTLSGFENHQGDAVLGPAARPLGRVVRGTGNGHDEVEGAVQGNVVATYLHGPVLVRNPGLADHLLSLVAGPLPPVEHPAVEQLRRERLAAAAGGGSRWRRRPLPLQRRQA